MRIIIDIGHPGHVHFFKNFIWEMQKRKHKVLITSSDKDVAIDLLKSYGFDFIFTSKRYSGVKLGYELLKRDLQMVKIAKKFKPDIITGINNTIAAHVSKVTKAKSIIFTDTEHAKLANMITFPFSDVICTPSYFKYNIGKKQVKYSGFHDLAYLHPNYFTPNPKILDDLGLKKDDIFIVLRFISWGASHDIGQSGIKNNVKFVSELEKYGKVLITSEVKLSPELEKYKVKISPEKLHDLLYYSSLYIGEGGTTASESATLGTHAIHISTTAKYCGVFDELHKYGLMWTFDDENGSIELAKKLLSNPYLWKLGKEKRNLLLKDQINVTDFMIWLFENFPESLSIIKQTSSFQDRFASGEFL